MPNLETYAAFCEWANTSLLIVSDNVFDPLIYYSHLVPILLSLPLAALILYRAPRRRLNQLFFLLVGLFSLWSLFDLVLWAHADPSIIMFFWSLLILIEPLIYFTAYFFTYAAIHEKRPPIWHTGLLVLGIIPIIFLLPTTLAIENFDLTNCWREVAEGPLVFYGYLYQLLVVIGIAAFAGYALLRAKTGTRRQVVLMTLAVLLFLLTFSSGNIAGSWFENWTIGQYGIFGMPIMVAILAVLIAKYKVFDSKILTAELLIGALAVLTLGVFFIQNLEEARVVALITFGLIVIMGIILIRSIKREVQQRQEIERLAKRLERANKRLKVLDKMKSEFVSIASHQLRSPLTSIRGYASMLTEGSYGKLPKKAVEAVERIQESSRYMALSVEDYLNVSRIEAGNMRYETRDFDLKEVAERVVDEVRPASLKKGLLLVFRSDCDSGCSVHADIGKTRQIIHNLIDNAMKYTPKGSITVVAHDDVKKKKMYVSVIDTGVGMSAETITDIFEKFIRAKNANEVNVTGTGLGLFVAKRMASEMGGDIVAMSDGEGKGSTFRLELPLIKGPKRT